MSIQILPLSVSSYISAGEVINNPASVVKELMENSIDANSTCIDIEIKNGGLQLIHLKDNGCGIKKLDLALALSRYSTSKIYSIEDLNTVTTFGFRGEALASINAVSHIVLSSCNNRLKKIGWSIYSDGYGFITNPQLVAHSRGTTITVSNLFFNRPVRRKNIKSKYSSFLKIDEIVRCLSLSTTSISVSLKHDNKLIRYYNKSTNNFSDEDRINLICGFSFTKKSIYINCVSGLMKITGWLYLFQEHFLAKKVQYIYVNGRFVYNNIIIHAIHRSVREIYHNKYFISYILFLQLSTDELDINVHPEKKLIKFFNVRYIHIFIYQSILTSIEKSVFFKKNTFKNQIFEKNRLIKKSCKNKNLYTSDINDDNNKFISDKESTSLKNINKCDQKSSFKKVFVQNYSNILLGNILFLIKQCYLLIEKNDKLFLFSLFMAKLVIYKCKLKLGTKNGLRLKYLSKSYVIFFKNDKEYNTILNHKDILLHIGMNFCISSNSMKLYTIPYILLNQNLSKIISHILYFCSIKEQMTLSNLITIIISNINIFVKNWDHLQILSVLSEYERYYQEILESNSVSKILKPIDIDPILNSFGDCN